MSLHPHNHAVGSGCCLYDLLCSESPNLPSQTNQRPPSSGTDLSPQERLEKLMHEAGNKNCADCGSPEPKWVSSNIGAFICIKCSGIHRSLGVHISKVLSLKLDQWTDDEVSALANLGGNISVNTKYEAFIPGYIKKPKPTSSIEERADFIRRKYELLQFMGGDEQLSCPFIPQQSSSSFTMSPLDKKNHNKPTNKHRIGSAFRNSWGRKEPDNHNINNNKASKKSNSLAGMVEFVGLIKVNVLKGTNLAVRDVMTSDPYVILSLGHQSVRTRVIKNNLNPVWNESLMLSIPHNIPPLKVHVYDKDTFSTDDFMGEAEIDIQPLHVAAKAYEKCGANGSMEFEKWVESLDNTLVTDGVISLEDGKIKQQISVKLQNVERGELEVGLECRPLTQ